MKLFFALWLFVAALAFAANQPKTSAPPPTPASSTCTGHCLTAPEACYFVRGTAVDNFVACDIGTRVDAYKAFLGDCTCDLAAGYHDDVFMTCLGELGTCGVGVPDSCRAAFNFACTP